MDPFIDDSVAMAKRLKFLKKSVELDVLTGLPHGFLAFTKVRSVIDSLLIIFLLFDYFYT